MKKLKITLKVFSFFLVATLVLQVLPLNPLAIAINNSILTSNTQVENAANESAEIIGEVESLRDEYTKHFRREDGSFVAAVYNEPIHYLVNNEWKEIDNSIDSYEINTRTATNTNTKYAVTNTSTPITFPEDISSGNITVRKNGNLVSFGAKSGSLSPVTVATLSDSQKLISSSIMSSSESATESDAQLTITNDNNAIIYNNVFENATLEYEVSSSMIKESIVVYERSDNYRYEFNMDFGSFIPRADDSGAIFIYETAQSQEPIMAIAPPYMYDEDNDISYDVTMELIPNGTAYTLVVEADKKWINSLFRDFPVVIDPTVILNVGKSNTYDVHVNQNYPDLNNSLSTDIRIGKDGSDVYRGYIKYNLPDLPDCSVVTDAKLDLVQSVDFSGSNPPYLCVYRCESDWNINDITWNNQPISDLSQATLVDFTDTFDNWGTNYTLEITKIVKDWYENGQNYGLMLASSDESTEGMLSLFSSNSVTSNYPVVTVEYVNNTGLEDYWNYESFSIGTNGTAYVNTYNGAFTYIHSDVSTSGLIAPLSVSHVYAIDERNASGTFGNMNFGKGFKLNIIEKAEAVTDDILKDKYSYRLIDADGTVHYFKESDTANRHDYEFNDNIYLYETADGLVLSNPNGTQKRFNTDGYLYQTVDNNYNRITINYTDGRITSVTDGGGKSVTLSYNTDNTLNYISDAAGRKTYYTYDSSGYLTQITYPDSTTTRFEYDSSTQLISKITSSDNSNVSFEYKVVECNESKKFYRIEAVTLTGSNNSVYDKIEFEYNLGDTYINNSHGDDARITFDNSGRAINILKNGKSVSVAEYHGLSEENSNIANNVKSASNVFTPLENREARTSGANYFEYTNYSTCHKSTSKTVTLNQSSSTCLTVDLDAAPGSSYLYTHVAFPEAGKTYTVSAYVNIVDTLAAGSVYMKLVAKDQSNNILQEFKGKEITTTNNQWERIHITATVPENTYNLIAYYGIFDGNGEVYVEDIYSEEADTLNRFNLAKNSSFESLYNILPFDNWGYLSFGFTYGYGVNPVDGSDCLRILGNPDRENEVYQHIYLNGKAGDALIFGASAWAKCSASGNQGNRFFGTKINLKKSDGTILEEHAFKFNEEAYGTMQTQMFTVTAQQDYDEIEIYLCYYHEINEVLFDDVFVYRDSYGTYYNYDTEGRVTSAYDDNGNKVDYAYTDSNDLSMVTASYDGQTTQSASYTYDSNR